MDDLSTLAAGACAAPLLYGAYRLGGNALDRYFTQKFTVIPDIKNLGQPRRDDRRIKGTAVICGGSIAGLWTALVASDHFEDVLILEPEAWLATEEGMSNTYDAFGNSLRTPDSERSVRTRVKQYLGLHIFQPIARDALLRFFPDWDEEVKRAHGRVSEFDFAVQAYGRKIFELPRDDFAKEGVPQAFYMTREMYERLLRRLVFGRSKRIRWQSATVTALIVSSSDCTTLSGVRVRTADGKESEIPASLVVDCTGATQAGLKWLQRVASDPKHTDILQKKTPSDAIPWERLRLTYETNQPYISYKIFVPKELRDRLPLPGGYHDLMPWSYIYFPIPGKERKAFMLNRVEGHRMHYAFVGWGAPPLPMHTTEITDWFRATEEDHGKIPEWLFQVTDMLVQAGGKVEIETGRYPTFSWIKFEQAPYVPNNFIAIGDSVMQPNPCFGQGCSKATIGAVTLDAMLRQARHAGSTTVPSGFGRDFFRMHKDKIQAIWDGTKPTDYQWDTTTPVLGEKLSDEWLMGGFGNIIMQLAGTDKKIDSILYKVRFFMAPPTALLTPYIIGKVLLFLLGHALGL